MIINLKNIFKKINKRKDNLSINEDVLGVIHNVFMKYDLIGVIVKGFPEDEYQLEESKLYIYIEKNPDATENEIYTELVRIIEEWFGESPLHEETLKVLQQMSEDIHDGLKKVNI